jgi:hypothetical protein
LNCPDSAPKAAKKALETARRNGHSAQRADAEGAPMVSGR